MPMDILLLLKELEGTFDTDGWWPAETPFEVMVGAILTQQSVWEKVAQVMDVLKGRGLMDVEPIAECDLPVLEDILRPSGFYRQKAFRVRYLARHLQERYASDPLLMLSGDLEKVRNELLSLPGVGNETADAMLLFAGNRPKFVAAAYVSRIFDRVGIYRSEGYLDLQRFIETGLPPDPVTYRSLYAHCVHLCKTMCRAKPRCDDCPLAPDCSYGLRR